MTKPVVMVLGDKPDSLEAVEGALRCRYEHDYLIISQTSAAPALGRLQELRAAGRPVAVVMAATTMTTADGTEFLARARGIEPTAKRVLVVPRGGPAAPSLRVPAPLLQDRPAALPVLRAMALGIIDSYLPAPGAGRDEGFHRAVSELLDEWAHDTAPALPAVRIIGQPQSARSHELRDVLARNSIPYLFHAADSPEGRARLRQAGQAGSALPVLVMYTGEVLIDPPAGRLTVPGLDALQGTGVFYGAIASEASALGGQHVFVVGGANSAGQAAVNLARHAEQVTIVLRGDSLAARMSRYLIDEINGTPNIDVRTDTEIARAEGSGRLEALALTNNKTGITQTVPASALVVLIGAVPYTSWLPAGIARGDRGFVVTGTDLTAASPPADWPLQRPPLPLETSMPGIFAAGDVRHRSIKRVASAVGEGSIAATQVAQHLQEQAQVT